MRLKIRVSVVRFRPWPPPTRPVSPAASGDVTKTLEFPANSALLSPGQGHIRDRESDTPTPVLNEARIRASRPKDRPYKVFDERGLFMLVTPSGGRLWRFRYRLGGVEKLLTLGAYPDVSLKRAREKRDDARKLVADEVDPSAKRQAERTAQSDTFEAIGGEWLNLQRAKLVTETVSILEARLNTYLYPYLGSRAISAITAGELLSVLRRIEARGKNETAHRVRSLASRIWRYAVATGGAERDITTDLRGALAPVKARNFAAITEPARVGELLRAIHGYQGHGVVTAFALKLAPLVFVRPGSCGRLSGLSSTWTVRMAYSGGSDEMGEQHVVPLSRQAVEILGGASSVDESWAVRVSVAADARPADVGEHDQCCAAPAWV